MRATNKPSNCPWYIVALRFARAIHAPYLVPLAMTFSVLIIIISILAPKIDKVTCVASGKMWCSMKQRPANDLILVTIVFLTLPVCFVTLLEIYMLLSIVGCIINKWWLLMLLISEDINKILEFARSGAHNM